MKYIVGRKVGMTQVFDLNGEIIPVTVVHCSPNQVIEVKTSEKNKYNALKIAFEDIEERKLAKAQVQELKKAKCSPKRMICEFRDMNGFNVGDQIKVDVFKKGEYVDVQGTTKGRGFTGAIFRWNFKCGPKSHGAGYPHRYQGSIVFGRGGSQGQRVPKGKKMSGHYGHELVTIQNLYVVDFNLAKNYILIQGAIPGPKNGIVMIKNSLKKANKSSIHDLVTKDNQEELLKQNEALEDKAALHEANLQAEADEAAEAAKIEAQKAAEAIAHEKEKEAEEARIKKEAAEAAKNGGGQQ